MKTLLSATLLSCLLLMGATDQYVSYGFNKGATGGTTITSVNGCVGSSATATTNCTISVTSGNLLVATSKTGNNSGTATPAFTTTGVSCVWVRAMTTTAFFTGMLANTTVYTCNAPSTASATVTVTWTGGGASFTDIAVSQWHSTTTWANPPLDRWAQAAHASSSVNCGTGTTPATQNPNDLLLAICQNFNNAETWGALSGWTNLAAGSRNTTGLYSKAVTSTGTQSTTVPLSSSDISQGAILALQASTATNCASCTVVQSANSSGETPTFDHISLTGVVEGDVLVYYVFHSNWSGSGTTAMADSNGNTWFPCNTGTSGSTSVSMTDLQLDSTHGMSCFYSAPISTGGVVTGQPTATDCASNCTFVGGVFMEVSGVTGWEAFSSQTSGTSTSGSNNQTCGSITTTTTNDLLVCGQFSASGASTAGTTPISFTVQQNVNGVVETGVWSSSGTTSTTQTRAGGAGSLYGGMAVAFK